MGLGRWEEAQVNFEAAYAALQVNINDPNTDSALVHRKHTLMTNIGSLMVKRGNCSWGLLFGREVASHHRVCEFNRGWAQMVIGEAELELGNLSGSYESYNAAVQVFKAEQARFDNGFDSNEHTHRRQQIQAEGNYRWAKIHALKLAALLGDGTALQNLRELETDLWIFDPEASVMAGLFVAEQMSKGPHRKRKLLELNKRAKRNQLGEVLQRISALLCLLFFFYAAPVYEDINDFQELIAGETVGLWERLVFRRGNTGG